MKKYWQLFLITWQNGLVYPISVLLWRIRQMLSTTMALTVWSVVYAGQQTSFGYQQNDMITYVFLVGFLQSVILATILNSLAEDIYQGKLSYQLMKPVNIFGYLAVQDIADKLKNFGFIIVESLILFLAFRPTIAFPDLGTFLAFFGLMILGAILLFLIMLLFGTMGFYSPETWGIRFLFYMFVDFTAGKLFPLSILPKLAQQLVYLTPFPYLSYVQTQVFLGRITGIGIFQSYLAIAAWIVVIGCVFRYFWQRGLREYGAMGH